MRKVTIIKFLANVCLLVPGNIHIRKGWFLSVYTILYVIGLIFGLLSLTMESYGHLYFRPSQRIAEIHKKLQHVPIRPIAVCLSFAPATEENSGEVGSSGMNSTNNNDTDVIPDSPDHYHSGGPNSLEDFIYGTYRILVLGVNVVTRIFLLWRFPRMIETYSKLLGNQEQDHQGPVPYHRFMFQNWQESLQAWSGCQRVFLFAIVVSFLIREIETLHMFVSGMVRVGFDIIDIPCIIFQIVAEHIKILIARESVLEVATFLILVTMVGFVNMIWAVIGGKDQDHVKNENGRLEIDEIESVDDSLPDWNNFACNSNTQVNFGNFAGAGAETQEVLLRSELDLPRRIRLGGFHNKISTIQEHISGIVGNQYEDPAVLTSLFMKSHRKLHKSSGRETTKGDYPHSDAFPVINFTFTSYFELMGTWKECSNITGFIVFLLFTYLTSTFCFNAYITTNYGLFSAMGIAGILRGIIIITKVVCVCNTAQTLRDMNPVLLNHVMHLKLKMLDWPKGNKVESKWDFMKNNLRNETPTSDSVAHCKRCGGLGSFLSEMLSYIQDHPFQLSAMGYFTVSRSLLTTITGVIVTYLVVLVQFQASTA